VKWSIHLGEELHKPVTKHFKKRRVFVKGSDDVGAADLIESSTLLNTITIFST
jgi:hypothetical protein